jgi:hypothetical protein
MGRALPNKTLEVLQTPEPAKSRGKIRHSRRLLRIRRSSNLSAPVELNGKGYLASLFMQKASNQNI